MVIHTELVVSVVRERFGQDCHCSQSLGEVLHKGLRSSPREGGDG